MELPENSIGPTDVIAYRECPRRMSYGMRRHVGPGQQAQQAMMPEVDQHGAVWSRAYGSAVHEAISQLEKGFGMGRAIQSAWNRHGHHLDPGDLDLLHADLELYQARDFPNTRTVLNEEEIRVFLTEHRGVRIYFRTRVDRLYERVDAPGTFIHVDYKSSRHAKSEAEVRDDLQLWMSNWALHEHYPEIATLVQIYDQLRYGQIPTRKTKAARSKIKTWLIAQVTAIIEDSDVQDDGLLPYRKNEWCAWCPILESCGVVRQLTEFGLLEIATLAPAEKQGRKLVVQLDPGKLPQYLYDYENAREAAKIIDRFVEAVARLLKNMPAAEREAFGYRLRERSATRFTPAALADMHEVFGDRFYELIGVTKTRLEAELEDEPELLSWALEKAEKGSGAAMLLKA